MPEDQDSETETEVDLDEDAEADMDSDEEAGADMDSDEEVVAEADMDSDEEVVAESDMDSDEEVEAEVDSDTGKEAEPNAEAIKIKGHCFVKGVCWIKVKFQDEDAIEEVAVWFLWYEFKNQLREYIKRRKLKGNAWKEPNANHGTKIVAILGHREKQLHILWNNGYHEWALEKTVVADKQSFVEDDLLDAYWKGQKKEAVKKSKKKKSKKK